MEANSLPPSPESAAGTTVPPPGARILFADDEAPFRIGLARRLVRAGFDCDPVASAAEALARLAEREYDVLLADIDMPGNQRLELLGEITAVAPMMPTVLLTGRPAVETAARSVALRVVAYLVKPPDFDELCTVLASAVKEHRDRRTLADGRLRLQNWEKEVARLQSLLEQPASQGRQAAMRSYLRLTLRNLVVGLVELENFLDAGGTESGAGQAIERLELLGALRKTVAVLERTKGQFKSKDLGDLRRELEALLR